MVYKGERERYYKEIFLQYTVTQLVDQKICDLILLFNFICSYREAALLEASQAYLFKKRDRVNVPEIRFPYVFDSQNKAKQTAGSVSILLFYNFIIIIFLIIFFCRKFLCLIPSRHVCCTGWQISEITLLPSFSI